MKTQKPNGDSAIKKQTTVKYERAKIGPRINTYNAAQIALEFCRLPDGTINSDNFEDSLMVAVQWLWAANQKLDELQATEPDRPARTNTYTQE